jgi:tetratricopeptide (TPR) repeat protein
LEYYKKVEAAQSENLTVILQIGLCLAELKQYDEALAYFFKLEYLDNESIKSQRAIAWCSFVTRKFEQAMKYYSKILEKKPQMQDYLNAGHVAWITGNINTAVQRYAIALTLSDKTVFINQFDKDKEILLKLGINKNDFPLMIDLIKYSADSLE